MNYIGQSINRSLLHHTNYSDTMGTSKARKACYKLVPIAN